VALQPGKAAMLSIVSHNATIVVAKQGSKLYVTLAVAAGLNQVVEPMGLASIFTEYVFASDACAEYANSILGTFESLRLIRLGVVLEGVYVTWYSIADPQYMWTAVNVLVCAESVITLCTCPFIEEVSKLILHTALL
jgi:hypothetical protein